jgi:argininosuccinate lyase
VPRRAEGRDLRGALGAMTVLLGGLELDRARAVEAGSDPAHQDIDAAEELVLGGTPFRDAYERVAGSVRSGKLDPERGAEESVAARGAPGPGGVQEALAAARARFAET